MYLLRATAVWLLIIAIETLHGIPRTLLLAPAAGDLRARQFGVPVGCLLILAVAWLTIRRVRAGSAARLLAVGVLWVVLTVAFEVGLGRLVLNLPWQRITEDYDVTRGGLMAFGLLFMAASPLLAARLRRVPPFARTGTPAG